MWRSLVAYTHGVRVVAGSNPVIPTSPSEVHRTKEGFLFPDINTSSFAIWEGFVGVYLKETQNYERSLDVNHDGNVDDLDKNGWRYYQGLPYDTRLLPNLIYKDMAYLYDCD